MTTAPPSIPATIPAELTLPGGTTVTLALPAGDVTAEALLPALRALVDAYMASVKRTATEADQPVTCRAGCAACCRQYVPVSDVEARALASLVEAMPEPRRATIEARFAEARRRLDEADATEPMLATPRPVGEEALRLLNVYHRLDVACPFLEDEACSIYADRPLICREYVATSHPDLCDFRSKEGPTVIRVLRVSHALHLMTSDPADPVRIVFPLVLGPTWIERQTTEPERLTAETWMARFASALRHAIQTRYGDRAETMVEADASSWTTVFATKGFTPPR